MRRPVRECVKERQALAASLLRGLKRKWVLGRSANRTNEEVNQVARGHRFPTSSSNRAGAVRGTHPQALLFFLVGSSDVQGGLWSQAVLELDPASIPPGAALLLCFAFLEQWR